MSDSTPDPGRDPSAPVGPPAPAPAEPTPSPAASRPDPSPTEPPTKPTPAPTPPGPTPAAPSGPAPTWGGTPTPRPPAGSTGTSTGTFRTGPLVIAAITVVALIGVLVWGGGGESSGIGGPGTKSPVAADPANPGSYGGGSYGPTGGRGGQRLAPELVAPPGGTEVPPTRSNAQRAWRVPGGMSTWLSTYVSRFPADGWSLGSNLPDPDFEVGHPRAVYLVVPDEGYDATSPGATISFADDPDHPGSTLIEFGQS